MDYQNPPHHPTVNMIEKYFKSTELAELLSSRLAGDQQDVRLFQTFLKELKAVPAKELKPPAGIRAPCDPPFDTMDRQKDAVHAAREGRFSVAKWLYSCMRQSPAEGDETVFVSMCSMAALGGHLEILRWLRENGCPWNGAKYGIYAVHGSRLDVLEWLTESEGEYMNYYLIGQYAARNGRRECLEWALDNGCGKAGVCALLAQNGHLGVLQWARERGVAWDAETCAVAALNGHLGVIQWARANGCPWDVHTCSSAAVNGHLGVLQWARENGCPWDSMTCTSAAAGGQLACLAWARENGCPWDEHTCAAAARYGEVECLEYTRRNGCPV